MNASFLQRLGVSLVLSAIFLGPAANLSHAIDSAPAFEDPALQARYQNLTQQLRCLVCQNESISDSNAPLAADLRRELRGLIGSGQSDEQVIKFLTDRYGDFVLYKPPMTARTAILWMSPVIAVLSALGIALVIIRRRAKLPIDPDEDGENAALGSDGQKEKGAN